MQCSVGIVIEKMLFKLERWLKREFYFPSLGEQQRIAECLSALDNLIAAQSRKIDVLNNHKKGLTQQLFPALEEDE
jgi:type I restriction enzyme S subunit